MDLKQQIRQMLKQAANDRTDLIARVRASGSKADTNLRIAQAWDAYNELQERLGSYLAQAGEAPNDVLYRQARFAHADFMRKLDRCSRAWFSKPFAELAAKREGGEVDGE